MGGGRRQAAPESIGVCSAADDGDVKQVLLEVYRVSLVAKLVLQL